MEANNDITIDRKLCDIFTEAFELFNEINADSNPTNSLDVQIRIKKCIRFFEDSTRLVSLVGVFSSNENYEEISSNDLKYILLPFFLANLHMKLTSGDRSEIVNISDIYYRDFLKRCEEYGFWDSNNHSLVKTKDENHTQDEMEVLTHMVQDRNAKILKYKAKKKLEDEIKSLKLVIDRDQDDESTKREFYIKLIKSSILDAHDEIGSLETEKQILEHMKKMKLENPNYEKERPKHISKPLKPIIITRDAAQKAVYGLGYPSMPTMTVEEFYEQRVADGIFPDPTQASSQNAMQSRMEFESVEQQDREEVEKERRAEIDDEEYMARNRAMDEYKDEHRRGEGNRHNRS